MASATWFCDSTVSDVEQAARVSPAAAAAARDALACVQTCAAHLRHARGSMVGAAAAFHRARALWRRRFVDWRQPCGNGLNVPDLLWVAQCHLAVCAAPREPVGTDPSVVWHELVDTLRGWDAPSRHALLAERLPQLERRAMEALVFWREPAPADALAVDLSQCDVSALSIGIDVHAALDNRTHTLEWKADQGAAAPAAAAAASTVAAPVAPAVHPLRLAMLASRVSFFCRLQLALTQPVPGVVEVRRGYEAPQRAREAVRRHVAALVKQEADETLLKVAIRLVQLSLASPGALEQHLRLLRTDWSRVGGASVVRGDVARRIEDLAASHKISQWLLDDVFAADALSKVQLGTGRHVDAVACAEVLQLLRDVWTLALWHNQLDSLYEVNFLQHCLVLQYDLRERASVYTSATRELRPRLPVLLRACAAWCVHLPGEVWVCRDVEEALVLWSHLVQERHGGRTETGVDIGPALRELTESHGE